MSWWSVGLTIIAADFCYYWQHRKSHEIRLFWGFHSVHHSSKEFNLSTAIRLPWTGSVIRSLFYVPLVLLGMDPLTIAVSKKLVLIYQFWIHSEDIGKLGWFDHLFNSPSNHRVHHASNRKYLDKNHGGILMIWDRLFGTYQREEERPAYGLTTPLNSYNPLTINFHEPVAIAKDMLKAHSVKEAVCYMIEPPGWAPQRSVNR